MHKKYLLLGFCVIALLGLCFVLALLYHHYKLDLVEVYVASHNLKANHEIVEDDLKKIEVPRAYLSKEIIIEKEQLLGSLVYLDTRIAKDSFFYEDLVLTKGEGRDADYRYLSLSHFDLLASDLANDPSHLVKNMKIDLYLTIEQNVVMSDLLFENVQIIALYDKDQKAIEFGDNQSRVNSLSLALEEEYIPIINEALKLGELSFSVSPDSYDEDAVLSFNEDTRLRTYFSCLSA